MPYVKSISIHTNPKRAIKYIVNPDKTENLLYVSGINCSTIPDSAYEEMKLVFETYFDHFFTECAPVNTKTPVKLFHFIQSFSPNENISPETAHSIAKEWAEKAFGSDRQIIVSTHVDKGHIHSHIIINPYDFNGKKFNSNKGTLKEVRKLSDTICLKYNIQAIKSKGRKGVKYKEWSEKKKGTSWKQAIRDSIDRLVYETENLDELLKKLSEQGYEIRRKKYISITTSDSEHTVRIHNLGEGYDEDSLARRIDIALQQKVTEKEDEIDEKIARMSYMERLYSKRIYEVSQLVRNGTKLPKKYNKKLPYSVENDFEVYHLARQLLVINRDGITSINNLEMRLKDVQESYEKCRQELNNLTQKQEQFKLVIDNAEVYFKLKNRPENLLSEMEKLKLKVSSNIVGRCGIEHESQIEIIRKTYAENEKKAAVLNSSFKSLEQKYMEYTDIAEGYKKISQPDYISRLIEEKKRKAGTLE